MMNLKRFGNLSIPAIVSIAIMFLMNNACKHDGVPADQMAPVPFSKVEEVYTLYCVSCHYSGGENGLDFSYPGGIRNSVTPGNSSTSKSYQAMISTFQIMPPNSAVPTSKRTLVRIWIDQGANIP